MPKISELPALTTGVSGTDVLPIVNAGITYKITGDYLLSLLSSSDVVAALAASGGYTNGQLFIGNSATGGYTVNTLTAGSGITITNGNGTIQIAATGGTVTSVDASGGTTGLSFSGGPITTSGTLTLAGTLGVANGGTNITSYAVGDIIYASGATTLSKLADVATGNALISGGVTTAPSWGKIGLTTHVSGTLAVASGGTNITSYAVGDIIYASGATTLSKLADVATGNVLISGGVTTAPAWGKVGLTTHVSGILPGANGGTNNGFMDFTGPTTSTKTFTLPNATATILTTNAAVTVAQGGTGLATLTANNVILGNGTSTPTFVAPSTSGNVLTSNGTTWTSAAPAGGGGWVLINAQTIASPVAAVAFANLFSSTYSQYIIYMENVLPATSSSWNARTSTNGGVSYDSGGTDYNFAGNEVANAGAVTSYGSASSSLIELADSAVLQTTANGGISGVLTLFNPLGTSYHKQMSFEGMFASGSDIRSVKSGGSRKATADVDSIQFFFGSGNVASGVFRLYGVVKV